MQHLQRVTQGTAAVLQQLTVPAYCNAGTLATPRQNDAQRTRLQQTAHPAAIARCAWLRLERRIGVDQNDPFDFGHAIDELYRPRAARLKYQGPPASLHGAYNLGFSP